MVIQRSVRLNSRDVGILPVNLNGLSYLFIEEHCNFKIYLGRFDVEDLDPFMCTHLMFGFAGIHPTKHTIMSLGKQTPSQIHRRNGEGGRGFGRHPSCHRKT